MRARSLREDERPRLTLAALAAQVVTPGWVADDHEFLDFDRVRPVALDAAARRALTVFTCMCARASRQLVEIFGGDVAKAEMLRAEVTPLDERKGE